MRNDDHLIFENYFKKLQESEEHTCKYAEEGCDCDGCQECKKNQAKSEDAEGLPDSIEAKRKERKNIGSVRSEDAESDNTAVKELHEILSVLHNAYIAGEGIDNETLGNIVAELSDILSIGFGSPVD